VAEPELRALPSGAIKMWDAFNYCEVFARQFEAAECERVIALHQGSGALQSRMPRGDGAFIRDSDLFWVARTPQTEWIFERVWNLATLYNSRYGFELLAEMDQLQLTRYAKGQLYNWHMDLGAGAMSRRKISMVVELAAGGYDGGGIEVFYGEETGNRIALGQGDALVFPSFIMHRALPVQSGTRWTLVSWLNGRAPLQ
jgi:predicted 2-oxoglutarate/Fe(II)-dependent dioxygenase YbiX